jgi:hypothetical protein
MQTAAPTKCHVEGHSTLELETGNHTHHELTLSAMHFAESVLQLTMQPPAQVLTRDINLCNAAGCT